MYIVFVVQEISVNLQQCMKSKKKLLKLTKGYTYTYMQLYTLCAVQAAMRTDPFLSAVIRSCNPFGQHIGAQLSAF